MRVFRIIGFDRYFSIYDTVEAARLRSNGILGELRVKAVMESFHVISSFLYGLAQRLNLTEDTLFDLDLAVEEASINVFQYAYLGRTPGICSVLQPGGR